MQHKLAWLHQLGVEYDASTFDTDPFEPEPDAVGTVFPFWVPGPNKSGFVELPYTLPQDFTLFVVLREANIEIWKKKLDWIAARGGMALINTHPDYMCFEGKPKKDEFPAALLRRISNLRKGKVRRRLLEHDAMRSGEILLFRDAVDRTQFPQESLHAGAQHLRNG